MNFAPCFAFIVIAFQYAISCQCQLILEPGRSKGEKCFPFIRAGYYFSELGHAKNLR